MGRTQHGNNNAYCQDNDMSWFDWQSADHGLFEFTRRVVRLRHEHPAFRRRGWFKGRPLRGKGVSDIAWLRRDGESMTEEDWQQHFVKSLMVFVNGDELHEFDDDGKRVRDASFLLLFNAHDEPLDFTLPSASFGERWTVVVDTATEVGERNATFAAGSTACVEARSVIVLTRP
jgi:isoamylase